MTSLCTHGFSTVCRYLADDRDNNDDDVTRLSEPYRRVLYYKVVDTSVPHRVIEREIMNRHRASAASV